MNPLQSISILLGGAVIFTGYEVYNGKSKFYSEILMPTLHRFVEPEKAHSLSIKMLKMGIVPKIRSCDDQILASKVWGKTFQSPIGIAAGFDKHAEAMKGLSKIGFGFIEVGSVTPLPQSGNETPRVFRLTEDNAVINRYGFNSCGHKQAATRLEAYKNSDKENSTILGVNLGKNKESETPLNDYVLGVDNLGGYADYVVINVSSPNTPGLRKLQGQKNLFELCSKVLEARDKLPNKPIMLVKIAPDLTENDKKEIAQVILKTKIDGLIISNTTVKRPSSLISDHKGEKGGLSGHPLKEESTKVISDMYKLTKGSVPIIGVGGVTTGTDAYEKIKAGASLVQIYTSLVYHGPPLVGAIKQELAKCLAADGFKNINDAIGVNHKR